MDVYYHQELADEEITTLVDWDRLHTLIVQALRLVKPPPQEEGEEEVGRPCKGLQMGNPR